MTIPKRYFRALTIAGSDSGGGAGIQADIKTFSALGVYGMSVITALTAQNTKGLKGVCCIDPEFVYLQMEAVLEDIGADAVKTGMLCNDGVIDAVAKGIKRFGVKNLVIDPVMLAKDGRELLETPAVEALKTELLPLAAVVTPNIPEAEHMSGLPIRAKADMARAAEKILAFGPRAVVIKGGHLENGENEDLLMLANGKIMEFGGSMLSTPNKHGTGCTFASAIAALLAKGKKIPDAVKGAKEYINLAIAAGSGYKTGAGWGPVHHFHEFW
jgi:hydroxymethylpyrimidine/phosphomethylpyrimidine kinase